MWALLIKDEGFADTELDNRHQQDDHEEHCRYSGGVAQLDVLECRLVDEHDDGAGGVAWPTLDHDKRLVEDLEAADDCSDHGEKDAGAQHGQDDVPEPAPTGGAVHVSC